MSKYFELSRVTSSDTKVRVVASPIACEALNEKFGDPSKAEHNRFAWAEPLFDAVDSTADLSRSYVRELVRHNVRIRMLGKALPLQSTGKLPARVIVL